MNFQDWWNSEDRFASDGLIETAEKAWDASLELSNPWRYPSRGELPEKQGYYLCCWKGGAVGEAFWDGAGWHDYSDESYGREQTDRIYAWRELPEPAPVLEDLCQE